MRLVKRGRKKSPGIQFEPPAKRGVLLIEKVKDVPGAVVRGVWRRRRRRRPRVLWRVWRGRCGRGLAWVLVGEGGGVLGGLGAGL